MDVFVSYSAKDIEFAQKMCGILREHGISYWVEYENEEIGENTIEKTINRISEANVLLVFVSKNANESKRVMSELNYAAMRNKPILPLVIDDVEISPAFGYYISNSNRLSYSQSKEFVDLFVGTIRSVSASQAALYPNAIPQTVSQNSLNANDAETTEKNKKNKIIIAVISALLVVAAIVIAVLVMNSDTAEKSSSRKKRSDKDSDTELSTLSQMGQETLALETFGNDIDIIIETFPPERETFAEDDIVFATNATTEAVSTTKAPTTDAPTTNAPTTKASTTTASVYAPSTTAEIVAAYNNAVNSAYDAKAGFEKQRWADNETYEADVALMAFKELVFQFMSIGTANKYTETVSKGKWESNADKHYLRRSTLSSSDVTSATCKLSGGQYTVTINVKGGNSKVTDAGKATNAPIDKCGICVGKEDKIYYDHKTAEVIYDAIDDFAGSAQIEESYSNAKIVANIDATTGRIVKIVITYDANFKLEKVAASAGSGSLTNHITYTNFHY